MKPATMKSGALTGRVWLILGASSAVARGFARELAVRGAGVILAGRDLADLAATAADARLHGAPLSETVYFDACDRGSYTAVLALCAARVPKGALDILLAFGVMPDHMAVEREPERAAALIDANLTAAIEILLHLALLLEAGGVHKGGANKGGRACGGYWLGGGRPGAVEELCLCQRQGRACRLYRGLAQPAGALRRVGHADQARFSRYRHDMGIAGNEAGMPPRHCRPRHAQGRNPAP